MELFLHIRQSIREQEKKQDREGAERMNEVACFICKVICADIVIILAGERIILYFQKKYEGYIESDDALDKIAGFFKRCFWPALLIWLLAGLAKIYVDFKIIFKI